MDEMQLLEMLQKMEKNSRRQLFHARVQSLFCLAAAVCCFLLFLTAQRVVPQIQNVAQQAEVVLTNLESVTEELASLDLENMVENINALVSASQEGVEAATDGVKAAMDGVKTATDKLGQIDLNTLNQAIKDLSDVVEPLAKLANRFK